ncbi:MAG: EamA family transporter [Firmicutes bacterium]|nr:EamA family transporter [Bacillota bacterium]
MFLSAMFIFGTIGIFRRYIPLPSGTIAMCRGIIGVVFLLAVMMVLGKKISKEAIKANLAVLCVSGALIGFNWIFLFESFNYTTVATGTLCYYMAPVFVILMSPIVLKEKLTLRKLICAMVALAGMVFVSGFFEVGISDKGELIGVLFGLAAGLLYGIIMLLNKKLKDIEGYDKTLVQLGMAALVIIPYVILVEGEALAQVELTPLIVVMMLIVGIVHTGFAYVIYFGAMGGLRAQTIALYSYLDPIIAVILSAVLLNENLSIAGWIGAVMILGATMVSERE